MAQSNAGFICFFAWASGSESTSHPPEKRAVALALINCVGQFQVGNIFGSYVSNSVAWNSRRMVVQPVIFSATITYEDGYDYTPLCSAMKQWKDDLWCPSPSSIESL